MEIGIGIHGESGRRRVKLAPASEITEMLATPVIEDLGLKAGERVLAFVNGMGGTPLIELYVVANELAKILRGRDITIARSLIGSYITSLEMAGCSITLLRLDDESGVSGIGWVAEGAVFSNGWVVLVWPTGTPSLGWSPISQATSCAGCTAGWSSADSSMSADSSCSVRAASASGDR